MLTVVNHSGGGGGSGGIDPTLWSPLYDSGIDFLNVDIFNEGDLIDDGYINELSYQNPTILFGPSINVQNVNSFGVSWSKVT